ncbi:MAG TPA: DUF1801 domain-containing protein [Rhizomicrobium sp.]|jgi:hypothetical protein|nr:DUF1801 domain-containing protein [Rhizomicrobium sp.]
MAKTNTGAVYASYPAPVRARLAALRDLVLDTARRTDGVGRVEEALKWGQPSFLTPETKSGSTIRIDALKDEPGRYAMYFHCQTNLVSSFREMYPDAFTFEGNRALIFDAKKPLPKKQLGHCIALALTYHQRKAK